MRSRVVAAVALLALAGCGSDDGSDDGSQGADPADPSSTSSAAVVPPGDQDPGSWAPTVPDQPVDPDVVTDYEPVLDAMVAAAGDSFTFGDAELSTETFDDLCVLALVRSGTGSTPTDVAALQADLSEAVSGLGFGALVPQDDPGGAVTLVATDDADALLEFRSKGETTVAVRVATTDTQCS